uniref:Uncharacterized protein n=1 Tax=Solanum tuberosum TaxID=4113 RepID=M1DTK4_SOLTU
MVNAQELEAQRQRFGFEAETVARGVQPNVVNNQPMVEDENVEVDGIVPPHRQPIAPRGTGSSSRSSTQAVIVTTSHKGARGLHLVTSHLSFSMPRAVRRGHTYGALGAGSRLSIDTLINGCTLKTQDQASYHSPGNMLRYQKLQLTLPLSVVAQGLLFLKLPSLRLRELSCAAVFPL